MAATRNERLSRRHYFPDSSPWGRASFLFLSQGDSSVQLPLPLGGTSVQSHLPQVLGFPMGEPPLQVSLQGALQASISSLEGSLNSRFSFKGTRWPSNISPEGKSLSRSPLTAYTSGQYPLSSLHKEPRSQDPSKGSIHYPGGTAYAWYPIPREKPLHAVFTYGGPSLERTTVPDKTPYRPPHPRPLRLSSLSSGGRVYPGRPTETPKTPLPPSPCMSRTSAGPPPLRRDFRPHPPTPPPAAPRRPLRPRRAG